MTPGEAGWVAGILDGEGCFYAGIRKRGEKADGSPKLEIDKCIKVQTADGVVTAELELITGLGSAQGPRASGMYDWSVYDATEILSLLDEVEGCLVLKREQARLMRELSELQVQSHTRQRAEESKQLCLVKKIREAKVS